MSDGVSEDSQCLVPPYSDRLQHHEPGVRHYPGKLHHWSEYPGYALLLQTMRDHSSNNHADTLRDAGQGCLSSPAEVSTSSKKENY